MNETRNGTARVDSGFRLMAADPHTIYAALVDADAVATWLPPSDMSGRVIEFDPRPGGAFRMELTFKDAAHATPGKSSEHSDLVEGSFVSLVPDREIVQQFSFRSDDPAFAGEMTMTWTLVPEAGGTRVTVRASNVPHGIRPEDHQVGLESSLANLADYTELPRSRRAPPG